MGKPLREIKNFQINEPNEVPFQIKIPVNEPRNNPDPNVRKIPTNTI